jgi:hypothetical protein
MFVWFFSKSLEQRLDVCLSFFEHTLKCRVASPLYLPKAQARYHMSGCFCLNFINSG